MFQPGEVGRRIEVPDALRSGDQTSFPYFETTGAFDPEWDARWNATVFAGGTVIEFETTLVESGRESDVEMPSRDLLIGAEQWVEASGRPGKSLVYTVSVLGSRDELGLTDADVEDLMAGLVADLRRGDPVGDAQSG